MSFSKPQMAGKRHDVCVTDPALGWYGSYEIKGNFCLCSPFYYCFSLLVQSSSLVCCIEIGSPELSTTSYDLLRSYYKRPGLREETKVSRSRLASRMMYDTISSPIHLQRTRTRRIDNNPASTTQRAFRSSDSRPALAPLPS